MLLLLLLLLLVVMLLLLLLVLVLVLVLMPAALTQLVALFVVKRVATTSCCTVRSSVYA
jgi:hypothetical protein